MVELARIHRGLIDEMTRLLEDFFGGLEVTDEDRRAIPSANIKELDDRYELSVAVPGFDKDNIEVKVEEGVLTIEGTARHEHKEEEKGRWVRREFAVRSFRRSFVLPDTVDDEKITAEYNNGILHITLPKREEARGKPTRVIKIK